MAIQLDLPYGRASVSMRVPAANLSRGVERQARLETADEGTLLREALAHPVGTSCLRDLARPGQKVVIVTSGLTSPCPSERLLPFVLDELTLAGIPDESITIVTLGSIWGDQDE